MEPKITRRPRSEAANDEGACRSVATDDQRHLELLLEAQQIARIDEIDVFVGLHAVADLRFGGGLLFAFEFLDPGAEVAGFAPDGLQENQRRDADDVQLLMSNLQQQWNDIVAHAPHRLARLQFERIEKLLLDQFRRADDELSEELSPFISGELLTAEEKRLLKAADRLSALIKCTEEQRSGNHEFDAALAQQKAALQAMHCPEADWFIEHCLPCYTQNLDELTRQDG